MIDYRLSGFVDKTDNKAIFFSEKDHYRFTFLSTVPKKANELIAIRANDGFLFATTYHGYRVAIASSKEKYELQTEGDIYTDLYIEQEIGASDYDITHFDSIIFYGGVLNSLMAETSILTEHSETGEAIVRRTTDKKVHSFLSPYGKCTLTIGNGFGDIQYSYKVEVSSSLYLKVSFDKPQDLSSIRKHYSSINTLISLMTNRQENRFEAIKIYHKPKNENPFPCRSIVHFRAVEEAEEHTAGLCFEDVGDGAAKLLELVYNSKEKKPSYSLGFIPKDTDSAHLFSDELVRAVCAGLECEISQDKNIQSDQEQALRSLCAEVKSIVKKHENDHKDNPILTNGTYAVINGSIDNWSKSAYETYCILYHKFDGAMIAYQKYKHRTITDDDIRSFVRYRNNITHGKYQVPTQEIINTTKTMAALVTCSILYRIGVPMNRIEELCSYLIGR